MSPTAPGSIWPDGFTETRREQRKNTSQQGWTPESLAALRKQLLNAAGDLQGDDENVVRWRAGEELWPPRTGDVMDDGAGYRIGEN